jgi:transposase
MKYYVGLDVSQRQTAVCIVDEQGKKIAESKVLTLPTDIHGWLATKVPNLSAIVRVGLESGAMSNWLYTDLTKLGLPMICLETFQAHQFLKSNRNKTDKNDARGLAQLVRMGGDFIRPVTVRAQQSREERTLLTLRQNLVKQKIALENAITGSLKQFGFVVPRGGVGRKTFRRRIEEALTKADERGFNLRPAITPSLDIHGTVHQQIAKLTRQIRTTAASNPVCQRLMTAPGVGPIVALSFVTAIDVPERFSKSDDIGAYFGLTPRQYQSGETDVRGDISRLGNSMTRSHLVQAATVLLATGNKWSTLRGWGRKIAKRRGFNKARIAVARKLAIVLHRMWINQQDFRWSNKDTTEQESAGAAVLT